MKRLLGVFLLGAAFLVPVAMTADDHHDKRYHERAGHDYHVYNSQEDRAYRIYLGEQHRDYREPQSEPQPAAAVFQMAS